MPEAPRIVHVNEVEPVETGGVGYRLMHAGRHEELYAVLSGRARFTIDEAGTFVFLPDPTSRRSAVAREDGTSAIAIGGKAGEPYEVSPWEESTAARALDSIRNDPGFPT